MKSGAQFKQRGRGVKKFANARRRRILMGVKL
jgi:hypothetical protein